MSEPTESQLSELQAIIDQYEIKLPKRWDEWNFQQKLDYVGERILMGTRTSKKHSYLKEQGWLSSSQLERRQRRELYGRSTDFSELLATGGKSHKRRMYETPPTFPPGYSKEQDGNPQQEH